jgi:hypothetical protein
MSRLNVYTVTSRNTDRWGGRQGSACGICGGQRVLGQVATRLPLEWTVRGRILAETALLRPENNNPHDITPE